MAAPGAVSIGLPGSLGPQLIAELAPHIEQAGFAALWVNDTPGGDSLRALAAAASVTGRIRLCTGVIPVDRRPATLIADDIDSLDLPADRLELGIGSGQGSVGALDRVRSAVAELRERTDAAVVVGALGPRMRALAAEVADGVLLNWLPADAARDQTREQHAADPDGQVTLYVRTIADADARGALEAESFRYASIPAYAANFARLGVPAIDTTLPGSLPLDAGIRAYADAVDEVVLRAITVGDPRTALTRFIEVSAGALPR